MSLSSKKIIWLLIATHLMMGLTAYGFGISGFNGRWLAHELDHSGVITLSAEHRHAALHLSDSEHRLLHSTSHFHPFFVVSLFNGLQQLIAHKVKFSAPTAPLYQAALKPPYRPPQPFSFG